MISLDQWNSFYLGGGAAIFIKNVYSRFWTWHQDCGLVKNGPLWWASFVPALVSTVERSFYGCLCRDSGTVTLQFWWSAGVSDQFFDLESAVSQHPFIGNPPASPSQLFPQKIEGCSGAMVSLWPGSDVCTLGLGLLSWPERNWKFCCP